MLLSDLVVMFNQKETSVQRKRNMSLWACTWWGIKKQQQQQQQQTKTKTKQKEGRRIKEE